MSDDYPIIIGYLYNIIIIIGNDEVLYWVGTFIFFNIATLPMPTIIYNG